VKNKPSPLAVITHPEIHCFNSVVISDFNLSLKEDALIFMILAFFTHLLFQKWRQFHNLDFINYKINQSYYHYSYLVNEIEAFGPDYLISFDLKDLLEVLDLKNKKHSRNVVLNILENLMDKKVKMKVKNEIMLHHLLGSLRVKRGQGVKHTVSLILHPLIISYLFGNVITFSKQFLTNYYQMINKNLL
jgi:hypothetical protein